MYGKLLDSVFFDKYVCIPKSMHYNCTTLNNPKNIVDGFAKHFHTRYSDRKIEERPKPVCELFHTSLSFHVFFKQEIVEKMNRSARRRAQGWTGFRLFFFKNKLLTYIAQISKWNFLADVCCHGVFFQVIKFGNRNDIANYWEISLISITAKLFKSIVTDGYCWTWWLLQREIYYI